MESNSDAPADASPGYEAPRLTVHGSVAEVTGAQAIGSVTDKAFPASTPLTSLTFSGI